MVCNVRSGWSETYVCRHGMEYEEIEDFGISLYEKDGANILYIYSLTHLFITFVIPIVLGGGGKWSLAL